MQSGYLMIATRPDRPGLVYVETGSVAPQSSRPGLAFAARFSDIDAALMHLHEPLRRRLKNLEPRCYSVELSEAIAVADAIELDHRVVLIEPGLAGDSLIREQTAMLRRRHRRVDWWLHAVGIFAVLVLVAFGFAPL
jgi:hypothetical protein